MVVITARATVTITVAAVTAIRNLGSVFAIFDRLRLNEGGPDTGTGDPRSFAFASEFKRGSAGTSTRLSSTAVGVTNLIERMVIPFEQLQAVLRETRYRVANPGVRWNLIMDVAADPAARLVTIGGATVVVSAISLDVRQYVAGANDALLPVYAPRYRQRELGISGAGTAQEIELDVGRDRLRGLTILQETATTGLVSDIINGFRLIDDEDQYIGEDGTITWSDLAADQEFVSGGNVFAGNNGSIVHLDFAEAGRLSHTLNTPRERNLRCVFDAQPSVAGAGASRIRILSHLLSRENAVGANGRRVVSLDNPIP